MSTPRITAALIDMISDELAATWESTADVAVIASDPGQGTLTIRLHHGSAQPGQGREFECVLAVKSVRPAKEQTA